MQNTNSGAAVQQGQTLAKLVREAFLINPSMPYKSAQAIGGYLARLEGYTSDWEMAQAFVNAFADTLTMSPEELKELYASQKITLDQLAQLIGQKLLEAPKQ